VAPVRRLLGASAMRVAIPLFGSRVAPRSLTARTMVLGEVSRGAVLSRRTLALEIEEEDDLAERLEDLGAELLVCGGIRREFRECLEERGVHVIENVAGEADEILEALVAGRLAPGYGLESSPDPAGRVLVPAETPPPDAPLVDCVSCLDRGCERGEACGRDLGGLPLPSPSLRERRLHVSGQDVAAETDPRLCRIAELTHFALDLGLERIGLAFCRELFPEIEVLVPLLSRFFTVVPVCCRVGPEDQGETCRPLLQAAVLERAGTELNVIAGLCLGSDLLFTSRSHAPVTTLFVRDRDLAHNPIGAIYTRYHQSTLVPRMEAWLEATRTEVPGRAPSHPLREPGDRGQAEPETGYNS